MAEVATGVASELIATWTLDVSRKLYQKIREKMGKRTILISVIIDFLEQVFLERALGDVLSYLNETISLHREQNETGAVYIAFIAEKKYYVTISALPVLDDEDDEKEDSLELASRITITFIPTEKIDLEKLFDFLGTFKFWLSRRYMTKITTLIEITGKNPPVEHPRIYKKENGYVIVQPEFFLGRLKKVI